MDAAQTTASAGKALRSKLISCMDGALYEGSGTGSITRESLILRGRQRSIFNNLAQSCIVLLSVWNLLLRHTLVFFGMFYLNAFDSSIQVGPMIRGGVSMEPVSRRNVLAAAAAAGTVATAAVAASAATF